MHDGGSRAHSTCLFGSASDAASLAHGLMKDIRIRDDGHRTICVLEEPAPEKTCRTTRPVRERMAAATSEGTYVFVRFVKLPRQDYVRITWSRGSHG